jgi:hypothetical protein
MFQMAPGEADRCAGSFDRSSAGCQNLFCSKAYLAVDLLQEQQNSGRRLVALLLQISADTGGSRGRAAVTAAKPRP